MCPNGVAPERKPKAEATEVGSESSRRKLSERSMTPGLTGPLRAEGFPVRNDGMLTVKLPGGGFGLKKERVFRIAFRPRRRSAATTPVWDGQRIHASTRFRHRHCLQQNVLKFHRPLQCRGASRSRVCQTSASPHLFLKRTDHVLTRPDKSHTNDTGVKLRVSNSGCQTQGVKLRVSNSGCQTQG